ncbi:MAG: TonB family protein [Ekhidna sp.]
MELKKNEKYDLESKRPLFFGIGMIISLCLTLLAFEWKSPIDPVVKHEDPIDDPWYVIDEIQITKQKLPEIPKPKVKKQIVSELNQIKEVEKLTETLQNDPVIEIDSEPVEIDFGEPVLSDEITDDPFLIVENMPMFPGGNAALLGFITKNIKYPRAAQQIGIEGRVYLKFVIDTDGSITDIELVKGIGAGCDEEAIRVLKLMPKFTPGKQRGVPVKVQMQLPVTFRLK